MDRPELTKDKVVSLFETRFIKVFDIQYAPGKHYYDATRREKDKIVALKSDEEAKTMLPDAVSCVVVVQVKDQEPVLLLTYEYRYPAGRYLLSVPAGLIDVQDRDKKDATILTAIREIKEETGITVKESDRVQEISHFLYSTPGMTDESNALMLVVLQLNDLSELSQAGAEGSENFDGFELINKQQALAILKNGCDKKGDFYSIFTHAALSYFACDLWK